MTDESVVCRVSLVTKGRKTGIAHSVMLRMVTYNGKMYFSRHKPDSDWFKNAIRNPEVEIKYDDTVKVGNAKQIKDEVLCKKISQLKYSGEKRANEKRVVIEVTPYE
ncbi:MAG: hypothetical protein KC440_00330 [Nitrosarchaeum sp.]|nr:hypothetical protein [Nitrosarchaeum sp.]